jgi:ribose-phosphate pyrophosphokinase
VPITARLVADLISTAGAGRFLTLDLHAGQIQGFFNIPLDELTALYLISDYFREKKINDLVVVATDVGGSKRARNLAHILNCPLAVIEKRRGDNDDSTQLLNVIGDVRGRRALIVDDEIATASTIITSVEATSDEGAIDIMVACTHGIFSGPAVQRLSSDLISEVVLTDTVPLPAERRLPKMTVLSIAPLIGEAISRIHSGRSVGALFQSEAGDGAEELLEYATEASR